MPFGSRLPWWGTPDTEGWEKLVSVQVMHEAIPDNCEDAEPLVWGSGANWATVAVFDGMGGAGSARYKVHGVERKGAYLASRLARLALQDTLDKLAAETWQLDIATVVHRFPAMLEERLREALAQGIATFGDQPTQLRSTLVRAFPTTAAIALIWPCEDLRWAGQKFGAMAIWAGDSRVYLLDPQKGLMQVSADDNRTSIDALQALNTDPPMDNCINASTPFTLNTKTFEISKDNIVFAATDGCFGYLPTPPHFEFLVLDTLMSAADASAWGRDLTERIAGVASDDATLAALVMGRQELDTVRDVFAPRHREVASTFIEPYERSADKLRAAEAKADAASDERDRASEELRQQAQLLWRCYCNNYENFLDPKDDPPHDRYDQRV